MREPSASGTYRGLVLVPPVFLVASVTLVFGLLFGYSTAMLAGVLDDVAGRFALDTPSTEAIVAVLVFSCFVGAILASPVSARIGRRAALAIASLLAFGGYGAILAGPNLEVLVIARIAIGLAVGLSSMVAPMYAAEATAPRLRGAVVSIYQLAITIGILAAYAMPLFLSALLAWYQLIGIGIIIGCLGLAVALAIPESPRWLSAKGRIADAEAIARFLGVVDFAGHAGEHVEASGRRWTGLRIAFVGSVPMVLVMCGGLFILQNLSGIDGILYYAPKIFEELGFDRGAASLAATFLLGGVNVFATVGAIAVVDRLGRRPLLIVGSAFMILGLSGVVTAHLTGSAMVGLAGLCLYIAAFAISLGPLPYVMMSELFPSAIREPGMAAASATSWLFNAMVAFYFLSAVQTFGSVMVFGFFTTICLVTLLAGLALMPETKGVTLDEIEAKVLAGKPLRHLGR